MSLPALSPETIKQLAQSSAAVSSDCPCARQSHASWESQSTSFPEELLQPVGKVAVAEGEPTVREYHPHGTNLWSPDAPIALNYYPANRSEVWQCRQCSRCYLRYTEYGGYYIDRRIRALQPALVTLGPAASED